MRLFLIAAVPIAFLLYGHALQAPAYLDDGMVLETASAVSGGSTRTLGYFSFFLNETLAQFFMPLFHWKILFYFRLGNLLIHVGVAALIVGLARELTRRYSVGLASGFLFLVHPVASQPVMYVTQRFESLATLFMVAAAFAYARFRNTARQGWLIATILFAIAAANSKETAIALPLWILLLEVTFYSGWRWDRRYLFALPVVALLAIPAWRAVQGSATTLTSVPWDQYLASQGPVLLKYLQLSVYPPEQYLSYGLPLVSGFSLAVAAQWALVVAFLATGILLFRRYPVIGFGIVTFFVLLLPVTLLPLPDLVFEHRVYPAFVGLALALGTFSSLRVYRITSVVLLALLTVYGVRTFQRSGEWNDDVAFYEAHRERFPTDPSILANLAIRYYRLGAVNRAIETLEEARRHEDSLNAYYSSIGRINIALNLVTMSLSVRDYGRARVEVERALAIDSTEPAVRQMEGTYYLAVQEPQRAVDAFRKLLELEPDNGAGWNGLSSAYSALGDTANAEMAGRELETLREEALLRHGPGWAVPDRYRIHVIFVVVLLSLAGLGLVVRWTWSEVGREVGKWRSEPSSW